MRKPAILITGANGEMGHGLLEYLSSHTDFELVTIDLSPLDEALQSRCRAAIVGDILDQNLLQRLVSEYEFHQIFHLAALLSTRSEYTPDRAHHVNVGGTLNLLELAHEQSRWHGNVVKFLFPSSIAAYGIENRQVKDASGPVKESEFNLPISMYGCNKLYCEHLGRYFSQHYRQLSAEKNGVGIDFRSLRFPGLISAATVPAGGTSDYGPEMLHAAAKGEPYACFVDRAARLPFMAMPDAIAALTQISTAPAEALSQRVYNVTSFSLTAEEIEQHVRKGFPKAEITYKLDAPRARIVDSWPGIVDDSKARKEWGWKPKYNADAAFDDYLIPAIRKRYAK